MENMVIALRIYVSKHFIDGTEYDQEDAENNSVNSTDRFR